MTEPTTSESAALLSQFDHEGWWFRAKENIVGDFLSRRVAANAKVWILACGAGGTIRRLRRIAPHCSLTGFDIDPAAVRLCRQLDPAGDYRVADLENGALAGMQSVDLAIALDVLEHLADDGAIVDQVYQGLRSGGFFVVTVPAHPWLFSDHDRLLGHVRRYRPRQIEDLLRRRGFEILHSTPLFLTAMVMLIFWRKIFDQFRGRRRRKSDVAIRLPDTIDQTLYAISRIEGFIARWRLPFGSTQFILAQKKRTCS